MFDCSRFCTPSSSYSSFVAILLCHVLRTAIDSCVGQSGKTTGTTTTTTTIKPTRRCVVHCLRGTSTTADRYPESQTELEPNQRGGRNRPKQNKKTNAAHIHEYYVLIDGYHRIQRNQLSFGRILHTPGYYQFSTVFFLVHV